MFFHRGFGLSRGDILNRLNIKYQNEDDILNAKSDPKYKKVGLLLIDTSIFIQIPKNMDYMTNLNHHKKLYFSFENNWH